MDKGRDLTLLDDQITHETIAAIIKKDVHRLCIEVPERKLCFVRCLWTLKWLRRESGVPWVSFPPNEALYAKKSLLLKISGHPHNVGKAARLYRRYCQHGRVLQVPGRKVGLVIGKRGQTIVGLQAESGAIMFVDQTSPDLTEDSKSLVIFGPLESVDAAEGYVRDLLKLVKALKILKLPLNNSAFPAWFSPRATAPI